MMTRFREYTFTDFLPSTDLSLSLSLSLSLFGSVTIQNFYNLKISSIISVADEVSRFFFKSFIIDSDLFILYPSVGNRPELYSRSSVL